MTKAKFAGSIPRQRGDTPHYFPVIDEKELTPVSFLNLPSLKHLRVAPVFVYDQADLQITDDGLRFSEPPSEDELEATKMVLVDVFPSQIETLGLIHCDDPSSLDRIIISSRELLARIALFRNLREVMLQGRESAILKEKLAALRSLPWGKITVRLIVKGEVDGHHKERFWGWDNQTEWRECENNRRRPIETLYESDAV